MVKYIYASFSKCRTKTVAAVFRRLGLNTYDFNEHQLYLTDDWLKIFTQNLSKPEIVQLLQKMYQDVDAVIASPAYLYWEEMAEAFPKAKIIFYMRETEDFIQSGATQLKELVAIKKMPDIFYYIFYYFFSPTSLKCQKWFDISCQINLLQPFHGWWSIFHGKFKPNITLCRKKYEYHNGHVLTYVHKNGWSDRFFHLQSEDFTWRKFCQITNTSIKIIPENERDTFPHVNKKGAWAKQQFVNAESYLVKIYKAEVRFYTRVYLMILVPILAYFVYFWQ